MSTSSSHPTPDTPVRNATDSPSDSVLNASNQQPASSSTGEIHKRACARCRERRTKCDRISPCTRCVKAGATCWYPERKKRRPATRKVDPKATADNALLARLSRLERTIEKLSKGEGLEDSHHHHEDGSDTPDDDSSDELERGFGKLVIGNGSSRYVNDSFWANVGGEVENLKEALLGTSGESQPFPGATAASFLFMPQSSIPTDLRMYHPNPDTIDLLWQIYVSNVDPLIKVIHVPTFDVQVCQAKENINIIDRDTEALMFAIYHSAIVSLKPAQCEELLHEPRHTMLNRHRYALEQALARSRATGMLRMTSLQALVIFLNAATAHTDFNFVWTVTAAAIRTAQILGLHHDASAFHLSPFDIEMRRRLWAQICILDSRASEETGLDPIIPNGSFDTKVPLNINDSDIHPTMEKLPVERQGVTDTTVFLLRTQIGLLFRDLASLPWTGHNNLESRTRHKVRLLEKCQRNIMEKYVDHANTDTELEVVVPILARILVGRARLVIYQPFHSRGRDNALSQETRDQLFETACDVLETQLGIDTGSQLSRWSWLPRSFAQKHALMYLLLDVCKRPHDPSRSERAWKCIDYALDGIRNGATFTDDVSASRGVEKLLQKALAIRWMQNPDLEQSAPMDVVANAFGYDPGPFQNMSVGESFGIDTPEFAMQPDLGLPQDMGIPMDVKYNPQQNSDIPLSTASEVQAAQIAQNLLDRWF